MKKNNESGQTLIEVLAALSITIVLLFGIATAVIFSLSNVQFTKNQNLANNYAKEGLEVVRQIWNSDLTAFNLLTGVYCLDKNSIMLKEENQKDLSITQGCKSSTNSSAQNVDSFAREVVILRNSTGCMPATLPPFPTPTPQPTKVTVKVSWSDNKCISVANTYCHKVELVSCLSKIETLSAP